MGEGLPPLRRVRGGDMEQPANSRKLSQSAPRSSRGGQEQQEIGKTDLLEYLHGYSDFSFELEVLNLLSSCRVPCRHGGSYEDPVTSKPRQYDLRARVRRSDRRCIRLAIECKRLNTAFPLLVSCVPRSESESYHQVSCGYIREAKSGFMHASVLDTGLRLRSITITRSGVYPVGGIVGKACAQVGRDKEGSIRHTDAEVYDRWAQAISSARDLVDEAYSELHRTRECSLSVVLPLLVVPDDTLWLAEYSPDGQLYREPCKSEHCSLFVDRSYSSSCPIGGDEYRISHLEIRTITGLRSFLDCLDPSNRDDQWMLYFDQSRIAEQLQRLEED